MAKRRRRRNPAPRLMEVVPTLLLLAAAYWLYRKFSQAGADIGRGASEVWNLLTIAPVSNVNAVQLPSGEILTVDAIVKNGGVDRAGNFTWLGVPYQISGRDSGTGYYNAKRIVT